LRCYSLAQGTRVELRLRAALMVQADGEMWVQHPARVITTRRSAVPVVLGPGRTHRAVPGAGSKWGGRTGRNRDSTACWET